MLAVTPGDPGAVLRPEVNVVVSSRRAGAPPGLQHALRALPEWSRNVTARRSELPAAAASLLEPLRSLELRAALHGQLVDIAREYCDVLGYSEVEASLELIKGVTCPRFHADSVEVRCLCTLCGPGTLWVEDRHVDRARLRSLPHGDPVGWSAITHPSAVQAAAPGEVLYLKGSRYPGAEGRGAVHRSPDADPSTPRLLLKLDDPRAGACAAGCTHRH
ncbi:succinylglutamate desuccinylase [Micractinium conductrix]|uniref:Succinylglutamate desuccinylase n=1 Tax=Micractinium conductrix TaxID=554055 RepID=A0A2P6VFY1_9CHLO|nr:succinylglutamate desuccinylase [Micractinium conductrix]|eukprot:PSC72979.1 succinylglutamate desuccinylase [Micractinium conductrix]